MDIKIDKIIKYSLIIFIILVVINIIFVGFLGYEVRILNLDEEGNIPTIFSSILLFVVATLLYVIAKNDKSVSAKGKTKLTVLSLVIAYIGIDETAQIHELVMDIIKDHYHTSGILKFAWVIPAFFILIGLFYYFKDLGKLINKKLLRGIKIGALIYLLGAFGMELVGGYVKTHFGNDIQYAFCVIVEESLEIGALIYIMGNLLRYTSKNLRSINVKFN